MTDEAGGSLGAIPESAFGVLLILILGIALLLLATWFDSRRGRRS